MILRVFFFCAGVTNNALISYPFVLTAILNNGELVSSFDYKNDPIVRSLGARVFNDIHSRVKSWPIYNHTAINSDLPCIRILGIKFI